jgi:hypothetical protein
MSTKSPNGKDVSDAQTDEQQGDDFDSCVPKGHATAPHRDAERDVNILAGGI